MFQLKIEIEDLPKMTNGHANSSWFRRKAEADKWKRLMFYELVGKAPPDPLSKASITCVRYSSREPDYDGLVSGFKHCIDALKINKIILDDKSSVIGIPLYRWEKFPKGSGKITIEVKERGKDD